MNKSKTNVVMENDAPICGANTHTYLGQRYSTTDTNQDKEIKKKRITPGWTAFAKYRVIFKGSIGTCLKKQVYNSCAETWAFTTQAKNKLAAAQTKMERRMLNIAYRDRKTNIWVREKTKVTDVTEQVRRRKWTWARQLVNRIRDNRWTTS